MKTLVDKVVVVTGAGAGIGRALAEEFAAQGVRLALSDIDVDAVAETATVCKRRGVEAASHRLDVTDRSAVEAYATEIAASFGAVNVVVNNAGVAMFGFLHELEWDQIDRHLAINVGGVLNGTKAFLPHLIASGNGHLVNLSSEFGLVGVPTQSVYCGSKFFVRGFTEAIRQDMRLVGHAVGVTVVHPGAVSTDFVAHGAVADRHDQSAINDFAHKWVRTKPHHVARKVVTAVRRNQPRVLVGPDAYLSDALARLLGARYQPIMTRAIRIIPGIWTGTTV